MAREEHADSDGRLCVGSDSSDSSDGEEYHDASDSDQWTEWWCGVASDSTTDEDDERGRLGEECYSDSSDIPERCSSGEDSGEGSGGEGEEEGGGGEERHVGEGGCPSQVTNP